MRYVGPTLVLLSVFATASASLRRQGSSVAPDDARVNAEFTHPRQALTADNQPNDRKDCVTAARIRRVIIADDTLSLYGHNVKIIVKGGRVMLEGPVHSAEEQAEVSRDAALVVPSSTIVNKVTVV